MQIELGFGQAIDIGNRRITNLTGHSIYVLWDESSPCPTTFPAPPEVPETHPSLPLLSPIPPSLPNPPSPLPRSLRFYPASSTIHAPMWRRITSIPIEANWIHIKGIENESSTIVWKSTKKFHETKAKLGWKSNIHQICCASGLVFYCTPDDFPRGSFIEVGAALAFNKPVYAVFDFHGKKPHDVFHFSKTFSEVFSQPEFLSYFGGTWRHHPLVQTFSSLSAAFRKIKKDFSDALGDDK